MTESDISLVGGDDSLSPEEVQGKLNWRGDPEITFSNWTLRIVNTGTSSPSSSRVVEEYHVHKCILAVGPRRSKFFAKEFRSAKQGYGEESYCEESYCEENYTRIELDPLEVRAFPFLLDYFYNVDEPLEIETETASALYSLGLFLDIPKLRFDARQYCKTNLSLSNIITYYEHAAFLGSDTILELVQRYCGENVLSIEPDSPLVDATDLAFWLKVSTWFPANPLLLAAGEHLSKLVVRVCKRHPDTSEARLFWRITSSNVMPTIHPDAALAICKLCDAFAGGSRQAEDQYGISGEIQPNGNSVQERCASALAAKWKDLKSEEIMTSLVMDCKAKFLVDLLLKSVGNCVLEMESMKYEKSMLEEKLRNSEAREASLCNSLRQAVPWSQRMDDELPKARRSLAEQNAEYLYFKMMKMKEKNLWTG